MIYWTKINSINFIGYFIDNNQKIHKKKTLRENKQIQYKTSFNSIKNFQK